MANVFYTPSGTPATNAQGSSSDIRSEFALVEAGLDKLPALTADYVVTVNAGGTALESVEFLTVAQGGIGAATLTDGGILIGSGTGAITAMAVLANGEMIVGDGTTDPAIESGATLRTSIGVGTGNDVSFNSLSLSTVLSTGNGGTGLGTHTSGAVLLGNGGGNIASTGALGLGEMIVGDGAGSPNLESGDTLRDSIGVGPTSSPVYAGLTVPGDNIVTVTGNTTNVRLGGGAGEAITTGAIRNTAVGFDALSLVTTQDRCTAVGFEALQANVTSENSAVGALALRVNTTGQNNTAFGYNTLAAAITANNNTAFGDSCLSQCTAGDNTAFGTGAMAALLVGTENVAVGLNTLFNNKGNKNTGIGVLAGADITTGDGNVMIGYDVQPSAATGANQIVIGVSIDGTADDQVSIGKASNIVSNDFGTDAIWTRASDIDRKREVENSELGLAFINDLRPVTYKWKPAKDLPKAWGVDPKDEINTDIVMTGLIAQEVEAALKKANLGVRFPGWKQTKQGQTISGEAFIFPLINAIHELTARLAALESK